MSDNLEKRIRAEFGNLANAALDMCMLIAAQTGEPLRSIQARTLRGGVDAFRSVAALVTEQMAHPSKKVQLPS